MLLSVELVTKCLQTKECVMSKDITKALIDMMRITNKPHPNCLTRPIYDKCLQVAKDHGYEPESERKN